MVDEKQLVHIETGLDRVAQFVATQVPRFDPSTELHGYEMFQGHSNWKSVPTSLRVRACIAASRVIADSGASFILRCINVDALNARYSNPFPEHQLALSQSLESVQHIIDVDHKGEQPVLVLADEHHTAPGSRSRFKAMRTQAQRGQTSIPLTCLVDTIYFGPSNHSRLLQAVDIATFFKARYDNVQEFDQRAVKAMDKIRLNLEGCCRFSYDWPR